MSRPKLSNGETVRLHVKVPAEQLQAINEWRFTNRVPSLSEAVRLLCERGLQAQDTATLQAAE